jgi:hypothetical protein
MEKTLLEVIARGHVDEVMAIKIVLWTRRLTDLVEGKNLPSRISIFLWERTLDYQEFAAREKAELGITTGGESEFLATHEAWLGYPRIHIPIENIKNIPEELAQGIVQHEVGHALLHGAPEFYQFRFSKQIQEAGSRAGFDLPRLQQLVYLLSVALKDEEVIRLLGRQGVGPFQSRLLEYLLEDTEEEHQTWDLIRHDPTLRKLALAAFLKTRLPIESLAISDVSEEKFLSEKWEAAYSWLTDQERAELKAFSRFILEQSGTDFQDRLERVVWELLEDIRF